MESRAAPAHVVDMANGSAAGLGKRKAEVTLEGEGDILEIMPIGAGSEVGRSCILLKFKGKHIMVRPTTCCAGVRV